MKLRFVSEPSGAIVELEPPRYQSDSFLMCMNIREQHVTSGDLRNIASACLNMADDMDAFEESYGSGC